MEESSSKLLSSDIKKVGSVDTQTIKISALTKGPKMCKLHMDVL